MNSVKSKQIIPLGTMSLFFYAAIALFLFSGNLYAEGSKDFVNYPGRRLFLDTRDNQQMKVYASAGEFINVGSSHVSIQNGFIDVYRPDGTLHVRFDNSTNDNTAIIFNNIQEQAGPIGGTTGYKPGVIPVDATNEGIWTVVFDYPGTSEGIFLNIDNNAPWNRAVNQPSTQRVVLAWDITVSQNAAGDQGGDLLTGRVYSNKYVSEILENGNQTSPTFYILSRDGFTYKVDFTDIDPFRFTVGSNSFGIVNGNSEPTYRSVAVGEYSVSDDPSTWDSQELYLYQLMAEDSEVLINNKIFFNPPASDLPDNATVTDIYAPTPNTHTTWLSNSAVFNPTITFSDFNYVGLNEEGIECDPNTIQTGIGGFAVFNTNLGGTTTLELDLNGDGDFDDPTDRRIFDFIEAGTDSIFWDGNDGLGNPLPISEGFTINYNIMIRGGEIHIPLIDIENNLGGVNFSLLDEAGTPTPTAFFYDHSQVGGDVSGGGTPGNPLPSTDPYTYDSNFGNDKIFDFWTFLPFTGDGAGTFTIIISENCVCNENSSPIVAAGGTNFSFCSNNDETILSAVNVAEEQDELYFTYFDPSGSIVGRDTVTGNNISSVNLGATASVLAGEYSIIAENERGCVSDTAVTEVIINAAPTIGSIQTDTEQFCSVDTVTITAFLTNSGSDYTFELKSPSDQTILPTNLQQTENLILAVNNLTESGSYTLIINSPLGCSDTSNFTLNVLPLPTLEAFSQVGDTTLCEGETLVISGTSSLPGFYTLTLPNGVEISSVFNADNEFNYAVENFSTSNSGSYEVTLFSDDGCASIVSENSEILVSEPVMLPLINFMGAGAYCEGSEVPLAVTNNNAGAGELTYNIQGPGLDSTFNVSDLDTANLVIDNFQAENAGEYAVIINSACTTDTVDFILAITPDLEYSNIQGANQTFCANEDISISANANLSETQSVTYTWTGPNEFSFTGTASGAGPFPLNIDNVSADQAGEYQLAITADNFNCENAPLSVTINVNEIPVIENITGGGTYCQLTPVILSAENTNTNIPSVTYTWLAPDGFSFTETVAGGEPLTFETGELNEEWDGIWSLIVTSDLGCAADTIPVDVDIDPAIVIFNLEGGGTFCAGESMTISANNGNPNVDEVFWTWENSNGIFAEGTVDGTETFSVLIEDLSVQDTGTYVLLMSSENACPIGVGTFIVEIEQFPSIGTITGGGFVCPGEDVTLVGTNTGQLTGPITYTWTGPNGFESSGTSTPDDEYIAVIPNVGADQEGTYELVLSTANGCTIEVPGTTEIMLLDAIAPLINASTDLACSGSAITLTANDLGENTIYNWFYQGAGGTENLGSTNDPVFVVDPFNFSDAGQYFVEITNACGETLTSAPITIDAVSGVDAFEDMATTEQEMEVIIEVMNNDLMGNNSDFNYEIIIAPQNGSAQFNADATITYTPDAEFAGMDSLQYSICSEVCPDICDEAWVYINVIGLDCFVPNYFTPNGDETNQTFFIDCLETNYPDNTLTVYNRWGDVVYAAEGYKNDWEGTHNGGTELPAGTYFYLLDLTTDGENCLQGYITIVK